MNKNNESVISNLNKTICINRNFLLIDLRNYFNNDGISYDDCKCDGDFDAKGSTFPAEELPPSNSIITMGSVPFYFPSKENGDLNNMVLSSQSINVEQRKYSTLYVLGAVDGQNGEVYEEEVTVNMSDGGFEPIYLGLSNWLLPAKYNEKIAFRCNHMHYPDKGQETLYGKNAPNINSYVETGNTVFDPFPCDAEKEMEDVGKSIWRPKMWFQKVILKCDKGISGFTFMDNLNFHIFSMTLEYKE